MTKPTRDQILESILELLQSVAKDWDYDCALTADTRLFTDLAFESLDLVVLGAAVQERFGQKFPFPEFFAEIGQRTVRDLTVREWVDFIHKHLKDRAPAVDQGRAEGAKEMV
jgi:acyl carrier protein